MKVVIIDERKGQEITPEIEEMIDAAQIHLTIHMDNMVTVHTAEGAILCQPRDDHQSGRFAYEELSLEAELIELPHRDTLSGEKSSTRYEQIAAKRTAADADAEPALEKAKRALTPTGQ